MEKDSIRDLEDRRRELQERWFVYRGSSRREGAKSAAWLAVGAIGVAAGRRRRNSGLSWATA